MNNCRATAARCLADIVAGASLKQQLPVHEQSVAEKDRPLFRQLCYGTLRLYPRLAGISQQLLNKPLKDKDRDILMLILLGIYQLSETRIPDHAAVTETVNATRALKKIWAKNLVNAVLRQWQRQHTTLEKQLSPAQQQAHPQWLHDALAQAWPDQHSEIESENNRQAPMVLRVNQQSGKREQYMQKLAGKDIAAEPCQHSAWGLRLQQAVSVDQLPGFFAGEVSVQDEAAQLAAGLLQLEAGQRVLDACCAPGGKSCHILEQEPALQELLAVDNDDQRLVRVTENLQRLGLTANLRCGDITQPSTWWDDQPFDRILLDAPCSATGVIRRNPDIKIHRKPGDISQLATLQQQALQALWPCLADNGLLLYATCSVLPAENEDVIAAFCKQQPLAEHIPIAADWGIERPYGRQLFPRADGHDGFYYALLKKRN